MSRLFHQIDKRICRLFFDNNGKTLITKINKCFLTTDTTEKEFKSKILTVYESRVQLKQIRDDPYQSAVVQRLLKLDEQLKDYKPNIQDDVAAKNHSLFSRISSLFSDDKKHESDNINDLGEPKCRGLYLHGSVGCGKTMLMDLFFENCCVHSQYKRRIHFHSFMLDFHQRFHEFKLKQSHSQSMQESFSFDPIPAIAREIVSESWLLCLDEFQVTDIGDAMILKNFFKELFRNGMVMVATSNRPPDELYKNGLQRSNFLPFIDLLKKFCDVYELKSGIDYRRLVDSSKHKVFYLKDEETDKTLDLIFKVLCNNENDFLRSKTLTIKGRFLFLKRTCGGVLDCTFSDLCDQALGAADYLTIAQYYHTVIIRDVPKMTMKLRSQARRFITMIDTFYDHHTRVIISAEVTCDKLFQVERIDDVLSDDDNRKLMDDLGMDAKSLDSSIFSGEEELFAFERALSRLYEMQTAAYWNSRSSDGISV